MGHVARSFSLEDERTIPEPNSGCIIWLGCVVGGYGRLKTGGIATSAHRESYRYFKGPIPEGMFVCHHCDTKTCVNPDHLYLGTRADNVRDAMVRGRLNPCRGQDNGRAKLTDTQAMEILASADSQSVLAKRYGVSQPSISWIKVGRRQFSKSERV